MGDITSKTCSVSGGDLPEGYSAKIDVKIDFDGVDKATERSWAVSHLIISIQRVLKKMKTSVLDELVKTGYSVRALDAGKQAVDVTKAFSALFAGSSPEQQAKHLAGLEALRRKE